MGSNVFVAGGVTEARALLCVGRCLRYDAGPVCRRWHAFEWAFVMGLPVENLAPNYVRIVLYG